MNYHRIDTCSGSIAVMNHGGEGTCVTLSINVSGLGVCAHLTPQEARNLADALLAVREPEPETEKPAPAPADDIPY